jgi:Rrf2 family transcriptional regulator, iron-sulfur cluster assembly transcription factor
MQLSRKADYALRAIRFLSRLPQGATASINRIAEGEAVPREFLAKILKMLTDKDVILSFKGVSGGYGLARRPKQISYLQVIEAVDGPIHLNLCTEFGGSYCSHNGECIMHSFWIKQEELIKRKLSSTNYGKYASRKKSARPARQLAA